MLSDIQKEIISEYEKFINEEIKDQINGVVKRKKI